jgi:UDP-N-acetylglucosamine:LPS N-acetylglucosamine transferase
LIVTASVGEGHDAPARALVEQLRSERPDAEVISVDCLPVMGRSVSAVSEGAARVVFYRFLWAWDVAYWLFARFAPTRELTQRLLTRMGGQGLVELVATNDPDVVVSVYPNATEVLGRLRLAGRLTVPLCAVVTDLAGMHYWATPGADLHLVTHPQSIAEVREIVGPSAPVFCVHGFTKAVFLTPRPPGDARSALGLPVDAKIVIVSGGGWGVGALEEATDAVLGVEAVGQVVCLCGRNDAIRRALELRFGGDSRVRVEGFTDQMPDWLAAADVLVHSTGGLTMLEAEMRGCVAISYGWGRGHVRLHNRAFRRFGLAEVATDVPGLQAAVAAALLRGRTPTDFSIYPSAASLILAQAEQGRVADAA